MVESIDPERETLRAIEWRSVMDAGAVIASGTAENRPPEPEVIAAYFGADQSV